MCFEPKKDLLEQCRAACANPSLTNCGNCKYWNWDESDCKNK